MRLWTLHPKHLDCKGLCALWREGLLALKVLQGNTSGYTKHSQLQRFKNAENPKDCLQFYLKAILKEAITRGYHFDSTKISEVPVVVLDVNTEQVEFEKQHLLKKLLLRDLRKAEELSSAEIAVNPIFRAIPGGIEKWERV